MVYINSKRTGDRKCLIDNLTLQKMTREINLVCNFFFGFMRTNLPTNTVDVELTLRTVQGIYICHKDHTMETTIFTPWSKSVIPFPSLRKKIKAFKEDSKGQMTLTWTPSDSTPARPLNIPRKCAPGKVRTWWSNHNHHFNLIKTNQVDTLGTNSLSTGNISIIKPIPQKVCKQFGATCSFCRQQVPHPSLNQSDWSSKDWDGKKPKARSKTAFLNLMPPRLKQRTPSQTW